MDEHNKTARAIILNDQGQLLMIERHKAGEHYYVLPGGHVDPGEDPEQAVAREVFEETGLNADVQKLLYTSNNDSYGNDQSIYLCTYNGSEPALRSDSIEAKLQEAGEPQQWQPAWFDMDQLKGKIVYPRGLLRYLQQDKAANYTNNPYRIDESRV